MLDMIFTDVQEDEINEKEAGVSRKTSRERWESASDSTFQSSPILVGFPSLATKRLCTRCQSKSWEWLISYRPFGSASHCHNFPVPW